jgi:uncharacterized protein (AIM24 family)
MRYKEDVRRAMILAGGDKWEYIYCFYTNDFVNAQPVLIGGLIVGAEKLKTIDQHLTDQGFVVNETPYHQLVAETAKPIIVEKKDNEAAGISKPERYLLAFKAIVPILILGLVVSRRSAVRSSLRKAEKLEKARQEKDSDGGEPTEYCTHDTRPYRFSMSTSTQPTLTFTLAPNQRVVAEFGALLRKNDQIESATASGKMLGLIGAAGALGASVLSGESMYYQVYRNKSDRDLPLVLGPSGVGQFLTFDLDNHPGGITACRGAFFAATPGVKMRIDRSSGWKGALAGTGLFRQSFSGNGQLFLFSIGELDCVELKEGETIVADTDTVFAWESGVKVDLKRQSLNDAVLSGEGLVIAHISGRGKIWFATRGGSDEASSNSSMGLLSRLIGKFLNW